MLSQPHKPMVEVETVGDVAVVRFTQRTLLRSELIAAVGEELSGLVEGTGCQKFVLDLANVERMTTALVGQFVALNKKVQAVGGRLALCRISPPLMEVFRLLNLQNLFRIYPDEQGALQSF